MFTEVYLDKYFNDKENLLSDLSSFLLEFNKELPAKEQIEEFKESDLNKIVFWNATGSGKTLLMHINLKQFNHYAKAKLKINKTILITPNEGLSNQHLKEFEKSDIKAEIFDKGSQNSFRFEGIEIIEVTKLSETEGDKSVAVESFEENNLVFIDEGHRGSSGEKWKMFRDKLSNKPKKLALYEKV